MGDWLIWARTFHLIATTIAAGSAFFAAFVAEPAFAQANTDTRFAVVLRGQLAWMAWFGVGATVLSGMAWLIVAARSFSDQTLATVFSDSVIRTVLTRTGFGHDWIARLILAGLFAAMLPSMRRGWRDGLHRTLGVIIAAALVGTLAWAGHARATEGVTGVHLIADILHLIAAVTWVGALVPLALLLRAARGNPNESSLAIARAAVRRFSTLGITGVATILATGAVNTWFLAGSVPALLGTYYGRLLLAKVALFALMVAVAAINRFSITPRLADTKNIVGNRRALRQLERNSAVEALLGALILGIVAVLGTIVPGLHDQAIWPLSFRIDPSVFSDQDFYVFVAFGAAWIAGGLYFPKFRWAIAVGAGVLVMVALRLPFIEAYPTSFLVSPTEFSAQSVAQGATIFATHCAVCHGPDGRGHGPIAASLNPTPADLTADHVYAHTDGDLFWWITRGIAPAMPPFGEQLGEDARWNLVDFIHANADATRLRANGVGTTAAFPTPDFSVACPDGATQSIAQLRPRIVHIVVAGPAAQNWLREVAARDVAEKLVTVVVEQEPAAAKNMSPCVASEPETFQALALYGGRGPVEGTEFLVDPEGNMRSMWRSNAKANGEDADSLDRRVKDLRIAPRVQRPTGMQGHHHHH